MDKSKTKGPGELTELTYYDYSGVFHGKSPNSQKEAEITRTTIANKPWWHIYNTWQLQGIKEEEAEEVVNEEYTIAHDIATEMVSYMKEHEPRIRTHKLWEMWGVENHRMKGLIGEALVKFGITRGGREDRFYVLAGAT